MLIAKCYFTAWWIWVILRLNLINGEDDENAFKQS